MLDARHAQTMTGGRANKRALMCWTTKWASISSDELTILWLHGAADVLLAFLSENTDF